MQTKLQLNLLPKKQSSKNSPLQCSLGKLGTVPGPILEQPIISHNTRPNLAAQLQLSATQATTTFLWESGGSDFPRASDKSAHSTPAGRRWAAPPPPQRSLETKREGVSDPCPLGSGTCLVRVWYLLGSQSLSRRPLVLADLTIWTRMGVSSPYSQHRINLLKLWFVRKCFFIFANMRNEHCSRKPYNYSLL